MARAAGKRGQKVVRAVNSCQTSKALEGLQIDGLRPIFCFSAPATFMAALEAVVEPVVAGMGYELVELQAANGGRTLRLFIDKPGGIDVEDCAAVSRQLSRVLEVE